MAAQPNPLDAELAIFQAHRREWAREHAGQFVLLLGDEPPTFHNNYESALKTGLRNFGVSAAFLIKQVFAEEPVFYIY
jgi:hypothetical protein